MRVILRLLRSRYSSRPPTPEPNSHCDPAVFAAVWVSTNNARPKFNASASPRWLSTFILESMPPVFALSNALYFVETSLSSLGNPFGVESVKAGVLVPLSFSSERSAAADIALVWVWPPMVSERAPSSSTPPAPSREWRRANPPPATASILTSSLSPFTKAAAVLSAFSTGNFAASQGPKSGAVPSPSKSASSKRSLKCQGFPLDSSPIFPSSFLISRARRPSTHFLFIRRISSRSRSRRRSSLPESESREYA
mmetsp:Transcript_37501/g.75993  ORF Transcript_37501/g.75993 Transcript_37501/m.75993 type:complete len:253 (+) Transcript_37501:454-1212(+)